MPLGMTFDEWRTTPPDDLELPDCCPSCRAELDAIHCDECGWDANEDGDAAWERYCDDKIDAARGK